MQKWAAPQRLHYQRTYTLFEALPPSQRINIGNDTFSQRMPMYFDSVDLGELPTSECNQ